MANQVQEREQDKRKPEHRRLFRPLNDAMQSMASRWNDVRIYAIHNLPRAIVNNASNFMGSVQLVAEVFLYKSGNNDLMTSKKGERRFWSYVTEPPVNIVKSVFAKSAYTGKASDFLRPSFYIDLVKDLNHLEKAAARDSVGNTVKLTNRWSARSGFSGITAMTLASLLPERKESAEETGRMAEMSKMQPARYVGLRLYQALNPLEWWNNKRSAAGLGMIGAGTFSVLSGFRQIEGKFEKGVHGMNIHAPQAYRRNYWQMAGGAITTYAGSQLFLAINNQRGWTSFGTTQLTRLLTLYGSIGDRFKVKESGRREQGAGWYLGGQILMTFKNTIGSLLGGAEIRADGTVVDHNAMRLEAKEKAEEKRVEKKRTGRPSTQVAQVRAHAVFRQETPGAQL